MAVEESPAAGTEPGGPKPALRWNLVGLGLLGCLVLGALTGLVWWLVAPLPEFEASGGRLLLPRAETESAVAADGWFAVCGAVAGALVAVAVFRRLRATRIHVLLGLTVAGLLSAVIAWWVGTALGPDSVVAAPAGAADGDVVRGPLQISAPGVLLIWPLVSVVVYFALAAGLDRPQRRRRGQWADHEPARYQRHATSYPPGGDRFNDPAAGGAGGF